MIPIDAALSLSEDGSRLYVADGTQGTVWSIDTATDTTSLTSLASATTAHCET